MSPVSERPGVGRELLSKVAPSRRGAISQALDQGCVLEPSGRSGGHQYRLVLPSGHKLPIASASSRHGGDGIIEDAFKNDLRRHGLTIDNLTSSVGVKAGAEATRRRAAPSRRKPAIVEPDIEPSLAAALVYADEIIDAVTQLVLRQKFEAVMREIVAHVGKTIDLGHGADREIIERRIEVEVGELVAHGHLQSRRTVEGQTLYSPLGYVRPGHTEWAAPPVEVIAPPAPAPEPAPAEPASTAAAAPAMLPPVIPAITGEAWAALYRASLSFAEFCRLMKEST